MENILYLHAGAEMYGADKVLLELVKRLDKEKFTPHVILPEEGILADKLRENNIIVEIIEYPILRRKYFNPKGLINYILDYKKYSKQLVDYSKKNNIDIIHNNTTAVLEGIELKRKLKIPLIWHVHEIIVKPKVVSSVINTFMGMYANRIVTVSEAVAKHVKQSRFIKENQVKVIYNGVDNNEFYKLKSTKEEFNISKDKKVVGMIGRVNAWKGQGDFLEAVVPLLKENKNYVAFLAGSCFAGEEWREEELDEKIRKSGVAEQIIRIPYFKETVKLYNLFDVFVLPSTNPDPLPTVVLEAMACGKPIVGYRHGGVCEMVKENVNGLLVEVRNTTELSCAIKNLLENDEIRKEFENNSLVRQKKEFSLESYIHNFEKEYGEIREKNA
jgi:alfa-galactose transferase